MPCPNESAMRKNELHITLRTDFHELILVSYDAGRCNLSSTLLLLLFGSLSPGKKAYVLYIDSKLSRLCCLWTVSSDVPGECRSLQPTSEREAFWSQCLLLGRRVAGGASIERGLNSMWTSLTPSSGS